MLFLSVVNTVPPTFALIDLVAVLGNSFIPSALLIKVAKLLILYSSVSNTVPSMFALTEDSTSPISPIPFALFT